MRFIYFCLLAASAAFYMGGCTDAQRRSMEITPTAYGNVDDLLLVTDDYIWEGAIGDTFRHYFEALYPVTPQPEPIFSIRHVHSKDFNKVLKTHRAIVLLVDLSDTADDASRIVRQALGAEKLQRAMSDPNYCMAIHRNRWAEGQTVIYWFAPNRNQLLQNIHSHYKKVILEFNKADAKKLLTEVYYDGEDPECNKTLKEKFGITLKVPKEYALANADSNTVWMRYENEKLSSDIFVAVVDDSTQLLPQSFFAVRNRLTKPRFSTRAEGSYMQIDDRYLPVYYQQGAALNGLPALHARGLWGMVGDFMGGSFISYLIRDEANKRVILLDGFVYIPGELKRPELRRLDAVFSTFAIGTNTAETR